MTDRRVTLQFTVLTFCIAYLMSGILIFLSHFGYRVYNWVSTLQQFAMNIPFAIYILSPAIASYIVLKKNQKIVGLKQWLKTVFYFRNHIYPYVFIVAGLVLYFSIHMIACGSPQMVLPFYTVFLCLPGGLIIGGLEESGWMYILQPALDKKYGFALAAILTAVVWTVWHIPLFFLPGTNHGDGLINFWMFAIQLLSFRFFHGAIYRIAGKSRVCMSVLFHTLFNAVSPVFGSMTMTWTGTIVANLSIVIVSIITVMVCYKKKSVLQEIGKSNTYENNQ